MYLRDLPLEPKAKLIKLKSESIREPNLSLKVMKLLKGIWLMRNLLGKG